MIPSGKIISWLIGSFFFPNTIIQKYIFDYPSQENVEKGFRLPVLCPFSYQILHMRLFVHFLEASRIACESRSMYQNIHKINTFSHRGGEPFRLYVFESSYEDIWCTKYYIAHFGALPGFPNPVCMQITFKSQWQTFLSVGKNIYKVWEEAKVAFRVPDLIIFFGGHLLQSRGLVITWLIDSLDSEWESINDKRGTWNGNITAFEGTLVNKGQYLKFSDGHYTLLYK